MERKLARYPRIVSHPAVVDAYLSLEEPFRRGYDRVLDEPEVASLLARDVDGCWYIDPFAPAPLRSKFGYGPRWDLWDRWFQDIREQLISRFRFELRRGEPAYAAKIRWLIFHFNRRMEDFPGHVRMIDVEAIR